MHTAGKNVHPIKLLRSDGTYGNMYYNCVSCHTISAIYYRFLCIYIFFFINFICGLHAKVTEEALFLIIYSGSLDFKNES